MTGTIIHGKRHPDFVQVKANLFSESMFEAADEWDAAVAKDETIQGEKRKLLVIHPVGTTISGFEFS